MRGRPIKYTQNQLQWIKENQEGKSRKQCFKMFCDAFNDVDKNMNVDNLSALCKRNGWLNGCSTRYSESSVPWNKGKKGLTSANKTSFKKGSKPYNAKPIGSERICSKEGYVYIKVAEPRKWIAKHVHIWEQANGKRPVNHVIRFIDNDKKNLNLDNLICVPRGAHVKINKVSKAKTGNTELNKAIILTETLIDTLRNNP